MNIEEKDIQKTKEIILEAAKKEFAEKGYDGARMGSIARKAKIHQSLIHYHFQNKDNLYIKIIEKYFDKSDFKILDKFLNNSSLTPSQKLYIIIFFLVRWHVELQDMDICRIINWEIARKGEHFKFFLNDYFIPQTEFILDIINNGISSGEFETQNPLYVVLDLLIFPDIVTPYWLDFVQDTKWDSKFNKQNLIEGFFSHLVRHTFKALSPNGKLVNIPEIPFEIMENVNQLLKTKYKGESHE